MYYIYKPSGFPPVFLLNRGLFEVVQVFGTAVRPEAVAKLEEAFAKLLEQHDQQLGGTPWRWRGVIDGWASCRPDCPKSKRSWKS